MSCLLTIKNDMIAMTLAVSLALGTGTLGGALADTVNSKETEKTGKESSFMDWIGEGMELIGDSVETGWNIVTDATESGLEWLQGKIDESSEKAEKYLEEHAWDQEVKEAWSILKQSAVKKGEIAQDKVMEAYRTVRDWVIESGDKADQQVAAAVDSVAAAAGVAEAQILSCYRTVESFVTVHAAEAGDAVKEAWTTIKKSAEDAGPVAQKELTEAYETMKNWIDSLGEKDSDAEAALEQLEMDQLKEV